MNGAQKDPASSHLQADQVQDHREAEVIDLEYWDMGDEV